MVGNVGCMKHHSSEIKANANNLRSHHDVNGKTNTSYVPSNLGIENQLESTNNEREDLSLNRTT